MPRPLRFELHVRPLIREVDRRHMLGRPHPLDLWDPAQVAARSAEVLQHLEGVSGLMPPQSHGGPWPPEWVLLFHRWVLEGHQTLPLAEPVPGSYQAQRGGDGRVTVRAQVATPNSNDSVWFDRPAGGPAPAADAVLYHDTPEDPDGVAVTQDAAESFDLPASATAVVILDRTGTHSVPVN